MKYFECNLPTTLNIIFCEYSIKCINPIMTFEFVSPKKIKNITSFERDSKTIGLISYNEIML